MAPQPLTCEQAETERDALAAAKAASKAAAVLEFGNDVELSGGRAGKAEYTCFVRVVGGAGVGNGLIKRVRVPCPAGARGVIVMHMRGMVTPLSGCRSR